MKRCAFACIGILFGCNAWTAPAPAAMFPSDDADMFAMAEVVEDDELGQLRGGFVFDGLDIRLGAQIQTLIDGELALMTTVNWTDSITQTTQLVSGALTPASAAELQAGLLQTGSISMNVGDASVYLANAGQTALIQRVDSGIQNVLINTASHTSISTQVNAMIDISGYSGFRTLMQGSNLAHALNMAVDSASIGIVTN
jgi:hypothetical protein